MRKPLEAGILRYAISDRRLFPGTEIERCAAVVAQAERLASQGIDSFQIREKDLPAADLLKLAGEVRQVIERSGAPTRLVLNAEPELAHAAGAGLHLSFERWSRLRITGLIQDIRIASISCHSPDEVEAASAFAELLLFAPVFEKRMAGQQVRGGVGMAMLGEACRRASGTPVLALGGVTVQNAPECLAAGASGIAGIRLFL